MDAPDHQYDARGFMLSPAAQRYFIALQYERAKADATRRLAEARQWPGFREAEVAIKRAMQADAELSLLDAYRQVVGADEDGWALTPDGFVRRSHD